MVCLAWTQFSIANGTRTSAATSYLDPVVDRPNLSVLIGNYVTRILETSKTSFRTVEFGQNQTSMSPFEFTGSSILIS